MPSTYTFPNSAEMLAIEQDFMPRLQAGRVIFEHFPQVDIDESHLLWEQKDDYVGLQQIRGLNGQPRSVQAVGTKQFLYQPGVYGEFMNIDEIALTQRRKPGTFGAPIDIEDLVQERQIQLLQRRLDRLEYICWQLSIYGIFSVAQPNGVVAHTDSFPIQTFTAAVPWSTVATATPLNDFRNAALRARGHSTMFGREATAYMNQTTMNSMCMNTNAADLYGRRTAGLGTFNNADQISALLMGDNLPSVRVYEGGYKDDASKFNLFIPDGYVVVFGKRPAGQVIGEYRMTRNANNPDLAPGPYTRVIDNSDRAVPREIQVHDGHNGGPVIFYPSSILVMAV